MPLPKMPTKPAALLAQKDYNVPEASDTKPAKVKAKDTPEIAPAKTVAKKAATPKAAPEVVAAPVAATPNAAQAVAKKATIEEKAFGREGDPKKVTHIIPVDMSDAMRYSPMEITVTTHIVGLLRQHGSGSAFAGISDYSQAIHGKRCPRQIRRKRIGPTGLPMCASTEFIRIIGEKNLSRRLLARDPCHGIYQAGAAFLTSILDR
ncbi:hypothetical protein [Undibacterium luofuense]|uniref:hypothetical protein n=1 Tax=Undibacterium luofuense TaxID=2828733 RepID=UPI0030EB459C